MKILFIKEKRGEIEGTGRNLLNRCIELNLRNIPYLVLYNNDTDSLYKLMVKYNVNVKYLNFPVHSPKNILYKYPKIVLYRHKIGAICKKEHITHIHVHNGYLLSFLDKDWGLPITAHHHMPVFNEEYKKLPYFHFKNIFKPKKLINDIYNKVSVFNYSKADMNIAVSSDIAKVANINFSIPNEKIKVVYNGTSKLLTKNFSNIRKEFNVKDDDVLVLCVATLRGVKGVEEFCEVAKQMQENKKIKFIFVGGSKDLAYEEMIYHKYNKYVEFTGERMDIDSFYQSSDIFLFLTYREGCSNSLLEAMSFGLPSIIWNVTGNRDLIKNDYNGRVCEFKDIASVKKSLIMLCDKKIRGNFSVNTLSESKKYSMKKNTNEILSIINRLGK